MPKLMILIDGQYRESSVALTLRLYADGKLRGDVPVRYGNVETTLAAFAASYGNSAPPAPPAPKAKSDDEVSLDELFADEPEPEAREPLESPSRKFGKLFALGLALVGIAILATCGALFFIRKPADPPEVASQPSEAAEEPSVSDESDEIPEFLTPSDLESSAETEEKASDDEAASETSDAVEDEATAEGEDAPPVAEPIFGRVFENEKSEGAAKSEETVTEVAEESLEDFFASAKSANETQEFDPEKLFTEMDASIQAKSSKFEKELGDVAEDANAEADNDDSEWTEDATADAAEGSEDAIRIGNNVVIIDQLPTVKTWAETLRSAVETTESWEKKAATITVPGDAATLADAIAKATKGDVIQLKGGKEIEVGWKRRTTADRSGLVIDKAVAIIGEEGATVVVEPSESLWITSKNVAMKNVVFKTNAKAVATIWRSIIAVVDKGSATFKGCRFIGVRENADSVGINASGAEASAKLWKCAFEDFGNAGALAETNGAIKAEFCEFERDKYGLCAESDAQVEAINSHFTECTAGYRAESGGGGRVENCFFKSCANPVGASMGSSSKVVKDGVVRED